MLSEIYLVLIENWKSRQSPDIVIFFKAVFLSFFISLFHNMSQNRVTNRESVVIKHLTSQEEEPRGNEWSSRGHVSARRPSPVVGVSFHAASEPFKMMKRREESSASV